MKKLSIRSLQPPVTGKINFAGWIDPKEVTYPITDTTHAQWMLDNYDWLESKGWKLPSRVEMIGLVRQVQTANVRNMLVKQGWIAVQSPARWHVKDYRNQARIIQDTLLLRKVNIRPTDYPIEIFTVDTDQVDLIELQDLEEHGLTASFDHREVLSHFRTKHGFKKESLLNMAEHLVTFKRVMRTISGQSSDWIVADAYDLETDKDLQMKFNLAFMEAGLSKESHGYYQRQLSQDNPDQEYVSIVAKVENSIKQMVDPNVKIITEKEYGRDDRSVIYIQTPKPHDFK